MRLIELVRLAKSYGCKYITIDKDGRAYGSNKLPEKTTRIVWYFNGGHYTYLGRYLLTCY